MITENYKQKENKPKEISLLRHEVAHYLLGKSKKKKAAHGDVQVDNRLSTVQSLVPTFALQDTFDARIIPSKLSMNSVQEEGYICFEKWD